MEILILLCEDPDGVGRHGKPDDAVAIRKGIGQELVFMTDKANPDTRETAAGVVRKRPCQKLIAIEFPQQPKVADLDDGLGPVGPVRGRPCRVGGVLVRRLDEHGAAGAQGLDHKAVVHDFMAHVNGRAELGEGPLDDFDGPFDAGAEATGIGEQDFHG